MIALLMLLLPDAEARGRRSEVRVAPPPAAAAPEPEVAPPPPAAPPGWNASGGEGAPIAGTPEERWAKMLDGPPLGPVATDGARLVVATATEVVGWDLDGRALWRQPIAATGPAVITVEGAWVGGRDGRVRVLDPATGAVVREVGDGGRPVVPGFAPEGKHVWWADADGVVWTTAGWSVPTGGPPAAGIAVDSALALVASTVGQVVAVGREGVRWMTPLDGPAAFGPALDAARAYVAVGDAAGKPGGVCAVGRDGATAWCFRSDFGPAAAPAVGEGLVLLPDKDGRLYALDAASGAVKWTVEGFGAFTGRPLVAGGLVYAGNADGLLYAIDPDDGGVAWTTDLGAPIHAAPTRVGELLVVPLANGRVVALAR